VTPPVLLSLAVLQPCCVTVGTAVMLCHSLSVLLPSSVSTAAMLCHCQYYCHAVSLSMSVLLPCCVTVTVSTAAMLSPDRQ